LIVFCFFAFGCVLLLFLSYLLFSSVFFMVGSSVALMAEYKAA
jgi:hypothetical protein